MREILFRGKVTKDSEIYKRGEWSEIYEKGKWIEGFYYHDDVYYDCDYITQKHPIECCRLSVQVDPETIGQYTGLIDKNGTKIFEGDIVTTSTGRKCLVKWFHSIQYCGWDLKPIECEHPAPTTWDLYESSNLEVIGNIYDNPELLAMMPNLL